MNAPRPLYLLAGPGRAREEVTAALGGSPARRFDGASGFLPLASHDPGVVALLPEALPPNEVVDVLVACAAAGAPWIPSFVLRGEGPVLLTVAPGYRYPLAEVAAWCATGEGEVHLSLPEVIEQVRVARHDLNNPLAAALAETQLLMMDAVDESLRTPLDVIQEQLRRIKDLVSALRVLRPPPGASPPRTSRG